MSREHCHHCLSRLNAGRDGFPLKKNCEILAHKHKRVLFLCDSGSGADGGKVTDESEFL